MSEAEHGRLSEEVLRQLEQLSPEDRIRAVLAHRAPNVSRPKSMIHI